MNKDQAFTEVKRHMNYRGNSKSTVHMYLFSLGHLFDYCQKDDVSSITVDDCMDYIISLKDDGHYAHSTLNLMIASFRYFFEVVLNKPLTHLQLPSLILEVKDPSVFSSDQIQILLDFASPKSKAMIILGIDCGLRVSEVAKLRCCDIDSKNMLLHICDSKRRKSRVVKLSSLALEILRSYWLAYKPGADYLFPSKDGTTHMNSCSINGCFRALLEQAGLDHLGFRFHSLRHTYATMMLQYGCDIFLLKKLLGHKALASTSRYINMNTTDVVSSFNISNKVDIHL